ncbi:hypothetical protein HU200_010221 [Digitaria exilis]|uniref:FBD domain-containing protein n=1 Tax=Digitaria exilis TaxID=1010633 RepID=A0A835FI68_9POAL|nr:hypothetical protein HU200_010221 [Digitaria exilis]
MARPNERCCRRCHRNLPGCSCGGGARHTRRSARLLRRDPEPEPEGDGADRISALHDDVLLQILSRLGCIHAAARTGLLSRRWRGLWARLPGVVLREVTPGSLYVALAHIVVRFRPQARRQPPLSLLDVRAPFYFAFSPHQISSLFDAAAALQPENLVVHVVADADRPCTLTLPRLDRTKSITLDVHNISLLPPQDQGQDMDMPALESLCLRNYDPLLVLRLNKCSALRSLSVSNLRHHNILIVLPFLEELFLLANVRLQHVCIFAPMLKKLTLKARQGVADHLFLQCLVPKVEDFSWQCTDHGSHVSFGDIWSLSMVTIKTSEALVQLQHTPRSNMYTLRLNIGECDKVFVQEGAAPSFQDYISSLFPVANDFHFANKFSVLELCISSWGHVYGAMVLHLLEVYTLIVMLKVDLRKVQARGLCSANCTCIQLNNWRNQTISLAHLKEVEIKGVRGEDYDIDMLKVILRSAAMLERVAFTFSLKSEQRIRHFTSKIHSILKAHPSVECKIYRCSGELVLFA